MKPTKHDVIQWARSVLPNVSRGPDPLSDGWIKFGELAYAAGRKAGMEEACNMYSDALQGDLEHGVKWLSEEAAKTFHKTYPELSKLPDAIRAAMEADK